MTNNALSTQSSTDETTATDRPYDGPAHTLFGGRGSYVPQKVTVRDIADSVALGFLNTSNDPRLLEKVKQGTWKYEDVFEVQTSRVDILAVVTAVMVEIEQREGVFPNIPENVEREQIDETVDEVYDMQEEEYADSDSASPEQNKI